MSKKPRVMIFYRKSHKSGGNHYHAGGLATNALHSVGVLRTMGIDAQLVAVDTVADVKNFLSSQRVTHGIIEAVWVKAHELESLAHQFPETTFVVRSHSKIGFLQVEPEAITIIREIIHLSRRVPNIYFSSNNKEFCEALDEVYGPVIYLPNLYDVEAAPRCPRGEHRHRVLKIASFGATRLLKLHTSAALAALQVASRAGKELEFYVNVDRTPGGDSVRRSVRNLFHGLPWAKLVEVGWQDSDEFKMTIASMDLVFQLSATETFCMVAADAVASGVPVVVGEAISWVPSKYQANIDNTSEAASAGIRAIEDERRAAREELRSLEDFVDAGKQVWSKFLGLKQKKTGWF